MKKRKLYLTKEELHKLYWNEKLSEREIAKKFKVTKNAISHWFDKYELPRRKNTTAKLEVKGIKLPSKEQLQEDYSVLSIELIAKKYNLSNSEPILTLLNKFHIKKRTRSESRKLALEKQRSISWNKGLNMNNPKIAATIQNLHKKHAEKIDIARVKQAETRKRLFKEGKLRSWNKGKKLSQEHRKKLSEAKKKLDSPEFRAKMREIGLKAKPRYKNTKPEKMMGELLIREGLTDGLKEQFPLILNDFGTKPDFAYPEYKVAIYCDGEYWHGGLHHLGKNLENMKDGQRKEAIKKAMKKDIKQHNTLWSNGWTPLRFWQHTIAENPEWIIKQIKKSLFDEEFIKNRENGRQEFIKHLKGEV